MLDAETRRLLDALPALIAGVPDDPARTPIETARLQAAAIFEAFAGTALPAAACEVEALSLPGPAASLQARLYRPAPREAAPSPAVLFLHGGGWSVGDVASYDPLVRALAVESGAVFLSLDYRRAPEHPFPAALDDSLAALEWLTGECPRLGLDPARIAVVGDSAGGALAAVVAQERARDLAAQVLIYPMTDVTVGHDAYPSRGLYGDGDLFLTRDAIDGAAAGYLAGGDAMNPRVSPMLGGSLAGAPPAYILTAEFDPLRDEGHAYAERLRAAGVKTEYACLEGALHAALSFGVLETGRRGRTAVARAIRDRLRLKTSTGERSGGCEAPTHQDKAERRQERH